MRRVSGCALRREVCPVFLRQRHVSPGKLSHMIRCQYNTFAEKNNRKFRLNYCVGLYTLKLIYFARHLAKVMCKNIALIVVFSLTFFSITASSVGPPSTPGPVGSSISLWSKRARIGHELFLFAGAEHPLRMPRSKFYCKTC